MKLARFFAYVFACIGTVLLIGSMGFFLLNRNAEGKILELPGEAVACSEAFAQALNAGDLEAAAERIYGAPDLGVATVPAEPETAALWDAFRDSLSFSYGGDWSIVPTGLARTGTVTAVDVGSLMEKLPERTQALMNQRIASAEDLTELYDEQNNLRAEVVTEILRQALQQAISEDARTVTREVTVKLIKWDGSWWVVPDQALLQMLSGVA